jgi:hypothetical protein
VILILLVVFAGAGGGSSGADTTRAKEPPVTRLEPSPEMARLMQTFTGTWGVREGFEVSASRAGATRQGTASFKAGPGFHVCTDLAAWSIRSATALGREASGA